MKFGSLHGLLFVTLLLVFGASLVAQEKGRHLGLRFTEPTDGDDIFMPGPETNWQDCPDYEPLRECGRFTQPTEGDDIFMPKPGTSWQDGLGDEPLRERGRFTQPVDGDDIFMPSNEITWEGLIIPTEGDDIFMPQNERSANNGRPTENRLALNVRFPGLVKAYLAWHGFIVPTDGDDIFMPGPGGTWQDCPPYEPLWGVFFP